MSCTRESEGRLSAGQTVEQPVQAGDEAASHSLSRSFEEKRSIVTHLIGEDKHLHAGPSVRGGVNDLYCDQPPGHQLDVITRAEPFGGTWRAGVRSFFLGTVPPAD